MSIQSCSSDDIGCALTVFSGQFVDYVLNRPDMKPIWHRFTHHPFVQGLGDGSLPLSNFKDYLVQDYLYLVSLQIFDCVSMLCIITYMSTQVHFARSNALASYKARTMQSIAAVGHLYFGHVAYLELILYTVSKNSPTHQHRNSSPH